MESNEPIEYDMNDMLSLYYEKKYPKPHFCE